MFFFKWEDLFFLERSRWFTLVQPISKTHHLLMRLVKTGCHLSTLGATWFNLFRFFSFSLNFSRRPYFTKYTQVLKVWPSIPQVKKRVAKYIGQFDKCDKNKSSIFHYWTSKVVTVRSPCLSIVRVLEFSDRGISQIGKQVGDLIRKST